ncbi:MAG TPA: deoxyribodipyrimidine photo-lyase [Candidatus Aminicenantes bacterium]|nr:MAG: deoxyribodipyrimidine photo-lyase [Candidatus Aminicenantes bacterium]HEK84846.1 deoxyribodipyrimidine photo-lyase [Candidatus Aminicenantes bacterium]
MRALFWFKRDLRLLDNKGVGEAARDATELVPVFIFDKKLLAELNGPQTRTGFLVAALKQLDGQLRKKGSRLYVFYGQPEEIFAQLISDLKPDALYTNRSYSWTGEKTQKKVEALCRKQGVVFKDFNDSLLVPPEKIEARKVYSPFFRLWGLALAQQEVSVLPEPGLLRTPELNWPSLAETIKLIPYQKNRHWNPDYAEVRLKQFDFKGYEDNRNQLGLDGTSRLSVALRFGLVSIRQVFDQVRKKLSADSQLVKELAWREFWYHIGYYFPWTQDLEFQEKRRGLKWLNREEDLRALEEARTGYLLIDAAINQLKEEGWMHNRARLVVASFVTKDLLIDWRVGEKFFKKYLLDYDEVVNTGNWQWSASVGADPRPFRLFNPQLQAAKYDPECRYIRKYVPELKKTPCRQIQALELQNYHPPIVDHRWASIRAKPYFK